MYCYIFLLDDNHVARKPGLTNTSTRKPLGDKAVNLKLPSRDDLKGDQGKLNMFKKSPVAIKSKDELEIPEWYEDGCQQKPFEGNILNKLYFTVKSHYKYRHYLI